MLDFYCAVRYTKQVVRERKITEYGGIAQLGERLNGIQEVSGSIPLISTKNDRIYYEKGKYGHFFYILIF